jgi:hypothetical protein
LSNVPPKSSLCRVPSTRGTVVLPDMARPCDGGVTDWRARDGGTSVSSMRRANE